MTTTVARPLRLLAQDAEDMAVISAAVQDAVARVADLSFERKARRFTLALNRYRWEAGGKSKERVRTALQFVGVLEARSRDLPAGAQDAVLSVLSVTFTPSGAPEDPAGSVTVVFAGGGDLRLEVECVDAVLADVSEPWAAVRAPRHGV